MNERFRELAEQAQIGLFEDKSFGWSVIAGTDQHLSKFAELIVKECADVATINAHQWESPGTYVLKHFGVTE
jgi:hypothetical protein